MIEAPTDPDNTSHAFKGRGVRAISMAEGETRGAYRADSTFGRGDRVGLWYLRPFVRMGLSPWMGALTLTGLAVGVVTLVDWVAVGSLGSSETLYLSFHLVYFSLTGVLLGAEAEKVLHYAESIGAGSTEGMRATLYSSRWALLVALPIEVVYLVPILLAPGFAGTDLFRDAVILGVFHVLVGASAVWAFAYSMRALHIFGHAPLSLKPFTEDRSLGLRPFGSAALRIVAIYEVAVLVAAVPMILGASDSPTGLPTFTVLGLAGLVLFILPLLGFRRRMQETKARELGWIGPRYEELVKSVRDSRASHIDEEIVGSLSALDKIQRDVQQIHTWPFDEAIVVRLISITALPLAVAVLARAVMILALHV